jgi:hypothetical protein
VFIGAYPHPVFHHLLLVIWRLPSGGVRLDAMHPGDEVGDVQPIEPAARADRLADALINAAAPGQSSSGSYGQSPEITR